MFKSGKWQETIDVRDFVIQNLTPYEGDSSFLQGPTERTLRLWRICQEEIQKERANNGVLEIDPENVSGI
ncbi:MAG: hypothetical protein QM223_09770, partial [Bacteroidota bacterium]|nr:hypothetical protein [Bacteroidota bacterium]